jgi:hypothetical protein
MAPNAKFAKAVVKAAKADSKTKAKADKAAAKKAAAEKAKKSAKVQKHQAAGSRDQETEEEKIDTALLQLQKLSKEDETHAPPKPVPPGCKCCFQGAYACEACCAWYPALAEWDGSLLQEEATAIETFINRENDKMKQGDEKTKMMQEDRMEQDNELCSEDPAMQDVSASA